MWLLLLSKESLCVKSSFRHFNVFINSHRVEKKDNTRIPEAISFSSHKETETNFSLCLLYEKAWSVFCVTSVTRLLCLPRRGPALHCSPCWWARKTGRSCPSCSQRTDSTTSPAQWTEETEGQFYPLRSSPAQQTKFFNSPDRQRQLDNHCYKILLKLPLKDYKIISYSWPHEAYHGSPHAYDLKLHVKNRSTVNEHMILTRRDFTLKLISLIPLKSTLL